MIGTIQQSTDGLLAVHITGYDEPNNGRSLWQAELFYKGEAYTVQLTGAQHCWLNFHLEHWQLDAADSPYYYLPTEGQAILIKKADLSVSLLAYRPLSTLYFKGNHFERGELVELFEG